MKIAGLGTGSVGRTLAAALTKKGHRVQMGTRDPQATRARSEPGGTGHPSFAQWHAENPQVEVLPFGDAAPPTLSSAR